MKISDKKRIAFIYEGIRAEEELLKNMRTNFLDDFYEIDIFQLPADGNIYMLWRKLVEDEFQTNVIDLLKEMSIETKTRIQQEQLKASDFSEIYLFFDYDGHAAQFSETTVAEANELCKSLGMPEVQNKWDLLERMLLVFDNETEEGKLYVSYPMIESIKEIRTELVEYQRLYIPLAQIPNYKHSFGGKTEYQQYSSLTEKMWLIACAASIKQACLIVKQRGTCGYQEFIDQMTQLDIYHTQKELFINLKEEKLLAIINSIPLFLIEYFDETFWNRVKEECIL